MTTQPRPCSANDMKRSYLVQRLKKPVGFDNPFSFGGGIRNGGLSEDAMGLLRSVWSFDYMGASEYEWGAVPEALQGLAKDAKKLTAFTFNIDLATVPADWRDKAKKPGAGNAPIYVLCRRQHAAAVQGRVTAWATEAHADGLRDSLHLTSTLRPYNEWDGDTVGWLELDNGFLFFTDLEMWTKACAVFGLKTEVSA